MIGFIAGTNDVYVFFENDKEIRKLEGKGFFEGDFINKNPSVKGLLKVIVDNSISDFTKTVGKPDDDFNFKKYKLKIKGRLVIPELNDSGKFLDHEGLRHVSLINAEYSNFIDKSFYNKACLYLEKYHLNK